VGEFYGSVSLRDAEQSEVVSACEALFSETGRQFLVAPEHRRWVTVYPSGRGQESLVAHRLACATGKGALYLAVHDGDTLAWSYYGPTGDLIDEYSSSEQILSPTDSDAASSRGRPDVFVDLVGAEGVERIRRLIESAPKPEDLTMIDVFWPAASLEALGRIFGLRKLLTCFEYAHERRRDVPARTRRVPAKDPAKARALERKRELQGSGLIRGSLSPPHKDADVFLGLGPEGRLLTAWWTYGDAGSARIEIRRLPRLALEDRFEFGEAGTVPVAISSSGNFLALHHRRSISIVDVTSRELRGSIVLRGAPTHVTFSTTEDTILILDAPHTLSRAGSVPPGVDDAPMLRTYHLNGALKGEWPIPMYHPHGAVHPTGRVAVASDGLFLLDTVEQWRNWLPRPEDALPRFFRPRYRDVVFTKDGNRFYAATDRAILAYDWHASMSIPPSPPTLELLLHEVSEEILQRLLVFDEPRSSILFAASRGAIHSVDLANRRARTLIGELPGYIRAIIPNDEMLVTAARANDRRLGSRVDVWNYSALRGE
jgi:hypothetical protein